MIPKTTNLARLPENLKSTEVTLDAEDMKQLRECDKNMRMLVGKFVFREGFTSEDLWDDEKDKQFVVNPPEAKKQKKEE